MHAERCWTILFISHSVYAPPGIFKLLVFSQILLLEQQKRFAKRLLTVKINCLINCWKAGCNDKTELLDIKTEIRLLPNSSPANLETKNKHIIALNTFHRFRKIYHHGDMFICRALKQRCRAPSSSVTIS